MQNDAELYAAFGLNPETWAKAPTGVPHTHDGQRGILFTYPVEAALPSDPTLIQLGEREYFRPSQYQSPNGIKDSFTDRLAS